MFFIWRFNGPGPREEIKNWLDFKYNLDSAIAERKAQEERNVVASQMGDGSRYFDPRNISRVKVRMKVIKQEEK